MNINPITSLGISPYSHLHSQSATAAAGLNADGDHDWSTGPDSVSLSPQGQILASQLQGGASPWSQLAQALQSGDLAGAQQAFATLQQHFQQRQAARTGQGPTSGPRGTQGNALSQDFSALAKALQSGDLTGAQDAFATLQQDFQAQQARHHHRYHGPNGGQAPTGVAVNVSIVDVNINVSTSGPSGAAASKG